MKINKRKIQYASLSAAFIAFFVAVVLLLNVLVGFLGNRFSLVIDLTENDEYSITESTREVLGNLEEDVTIYIMCSKSDIDQMKRSTTQATEAQYEPQIQAAETAERIAGASGGKVKVEYINPNQNPKFYDNFPKAKATNDSNRAAFLIVSGERRYSSILLSDIFASNKNKTMLLYSTESELTGAILHVTAKELSKAAIITGHNESALNEFDVLIDANGFERVTIDISKEDIPDDANNVIISGPDFDYTAEEIAKLDKFMARPGSNLYVFWNGALTTKLPVLERFLADWGLAVEPTTVVDEKSSYQTPLIVAGTIPSNDVTQRIPESQQRLLAPQVHPVKILFEERSNMRVLPISVTSSASYATSFSNGSSLDSGMQEGDEKGPFAIAAVSEKVTQDNTGHLKEYRVFLFGCEYMADDEIIGISAALNHTLFNELINYSNPDASTISIAPKLKQSYSLDYYESEIEVLFWILVVILPALILAAGIFIFIRRRHR